MQSFVSNVTGRAERKTLNGREYLVVPVSMIVPGVLAGSKGPLYYPQERVARNAAEWDGIPVTLGHPSHPTNNSPLSASDAGVIDRVGMGVLRNSRFQNGKLRADAWLESDKTRQIAPQVHSAALNGGRVEVSTGLFTQEVERDGTWNGRSYTHEVVDYKPDHLAILTDQRGACSIQDGCGMNVHNAESITINNVTCPCGGTCRYCIAQNAMGVAGKKSVKARPAAASGSAEAATRVAEYAGAITPKRAAAPAVVANDDDEDDEEMTDNDGIQAPVTPPMSSSSMEAPATPPTDNDGCPCEGECKSCQTKNAEDEGKWVTLPNGVHIQVKDGEIVKGPDVGSKSDDKGSMGSSSHKERLERDRGKGRGVLRTATGYKEYDKNGTKHYDKEGRITGFEPNKTSHEKRFGPKVPKEVADAKARLGRVMDRPIKMRTRNNELTDNWCNQHGGDSCSTGGGSAKGGGTFHDPKTLAKEASKAAAKAGTKGSGKDALKATEAAGAKSNFPTAKHAAAAMAHESAASLAIDKGVSELHKEAAFYHKEAASKGGDKKGDNVLAHSYTAKAATDKANELSKSATTKDQHNLAKSLHYEASDQHDRAAATAREGGKIKLAERHEKMSEKHASIARSHKSQMTKNAEVIDLVLNQFLESSMGISCPCGGTCGSCRANNSDAQLSTESANICKMEMPKDDDNDPQPRCPIKKTFQPRGFKGPGRGEAHQAAKKGIADVGEAAKELNKIAINSQLDRDVSGLINLGESAMNRPQMIQTLTTNCDCYKGKHGAVLNSMTDEQLNFILVNAGAVEEEEKPAGKKMMFGKPVAAVPAEEEEEEEEEEQPVMNKPTKNAKTTQEWLQSAPREIRTLVGNAINAERAAKEQLVDVLTANVSEPSANAALRKTYFALPLKVLQAQAAAFQQTQNADPFAGEFDLGQSANYGGAGLSSFDQGVTANRFGGREEAIIEEPAYGSNKN
jgi:hypothetical protein